MKYKIGDKVKVIDVLNNTDYFKKYIDIEGIIVDTCNPNSGYNYIVEFDKKYDESERTAWKEEELELVEKPPLGVMPRRIYEMQRIQDLCRALYDYSKLDKLNIGLMKEWTCELIDRLYDIEDLFD